MPNGSSREFRPDGANSVSNPLLSKGSDRSDDNEEELDRDGRDYSHYPVRYRDSWSLPRRLCPLRRKTTAVLPGTLRQRARGASKDQFV